MADTEAPNNPVLSFENCLEELEKVVKELESRRSAAGAIARAV